MVYSLFVKKQCRFTLDGVPYAKFGGVSLQKLDELAPLKDIVKALGACNLKEGDCNLYVSVLAWGRAVFLWTTFWFRQHFRGKLELTLTDFSLDRFRVPNPFWQFAQIKHTRCED